MFPKLIVKKVLTDDAKNWLITPVSCKEVKKVVFLFNPDKALGFNAHFYQKNGVLWVRMLHWQWSLFQVRSTLERDLSCICFSCSQEYKTNSLADYRPILCCNLIHKFIIKVITNRLKQVVSDLVSGNQCGFFGKKEYL